MLYFVSSLERILLDRVDPFVNPPSKYASFILDVVEVDVPAFGVFMVIDSVDDIFVVPFSLCGVVIGVYCDAVEYMYMLNVLAAVTVVELASEFELAV